jgi:hypothetical protein
MLHPETLAAGTEAGYANGFAWYTAGRGGVLGDVDADVVISSFAYFEPGLVRKMWEAGTAVEGARAAGRRYAKACADWGAKRLSGVAGMDRLAQLADKVIDKASVEGLTLFAGWRAEERPSDPAAHAYFDIHLLRELRGCVHIIATTAQGLSALESILTDANGGAGRAKMFGWAEPFPHRSRHSVRQPSRTPTACSRSSTRCSPAPSVQNSSSSSARRRKRSTPRSNCCGARQNGRCPGGGPGTEPDGCA